jgi:hypothetical protein
MPVIATDSNRYSEVVAFEFEPSSGYCYEAVVLNDSAGTLQVGTVLGRVTATGKYKVARSAASDGSQNPVAVYVRNVNGTSDELTIPANTDVRALAIIRGPVKLKESGLVLGTGITLAAVRTAFAALNPPVLVDTAL